MKLSRAAIGGLQALPLLWILMAISYSSIFVGTVQATTRTYYPSSSYILTGSHVSGDMNSLVNVDTDYYIVRSASSATATLSYNPNGYNLLGSTSLISGAVSDLASNNQVYMTFRSYASATSAQTLYAHQDTTTIASINYYLSKLTSADASGTSLTVDMGSTGRKLWGKFVYQLTGVSSIPASTWTIYYRVMRDRGDYMGDLVGHADVDILIRKSDGTVRQTIASNVAASGNLGTSWATLSGTYAWAAYTVVDQTDYLEIDYYCDVTDSSSGKQGYLRIDDNTLAVGDQTRAYNVILPSQFTSEVEFTGSSNTYDWTELVWKVDSSWTEASVPVTIQLYNYSALSYPSSGDGYMSYTSSGTPNTDETKTQTITSNPQNFRDSSGNWKTKIKGVKATSTQFDFKADWVEYKTTYSSEYVASTEFNFSGMTGYTPTRLVFTVVSQYDIASVTMQVYNYNTGQYATSGEGYLTYTSSATPSTDETKTLTITTNPSYYVSSGEAKIKVAGVKTTTTQFQQKTNQIKLDYDYSPTNKIVFATAAQMITAGEASAVMTIQTQDASSNPVNVPSDMTITLSSTSGTGKFSLSASPWSDITSVTITAGSSIASFYYKDTTAGTPTITASESPSQGWVDAAQEQAVNPAALAHFTFNTISSPQTAGTAFSITITAKDQYENNVTSYTGTNRLSDTTGTISPTSTGAFISGFWPGIVIINKAQAGVTITTTGSGKSGTSNPFDVNPQSINKVVITVYPSSVTAGSWTSKYTVQKRDRSGNPTTIGSVTVNLASTSSGANKKFSLTPGGSPVNSVTIPDGFSTRDFYYYDELSGTWTISVAAGATGDSKPLTVNPASLDHFTFANIPSPQTANISFTITITARDVYENIVTSYAGTNTLSDLTGTIKPTSTGTFASGAWTGSVIITKAQKGVIITTTGGGKSGTSNTLNIIDASSDFALYISPTRLFLAQNDSGIVTVEVMSIAGFQDDVALTVENVPAGFNCSFEHPTVAPLPYAYVETKLILQRNGLPSPGSYTLTVIGSSGAKTHTASFLLVVSPTSYGKCVIATATYGSELTPQVQFLKDFKDHYVLSTFAGSEFMKVFNSWYYSFSPQVASWIASNPSAKEAAKILLLPLLNILRLSEISYSTLSFAPEVAVVVAGIVASFLIGIVYFGPILAVVCMKLVYRRAQLLFIWATLIWGFSLLLLAIGLVSAPYLVMSASSILVLSTMILGSWSIPLATSKIFNPDWKMKIHILGGTPNDLLTTELEGNPLEYEPPLDSTTWSTCRCSLFGQQCHLRISGRLVGWSGAGITPLGV